jgi:phospholipid/cholesterol/gamma-HCH transport system substrate-binding protein
MRLSREAQIGLLFIVAAVALFFGFNYLKGHSIFQRYNTYYAVFENADNLSTSDKVLYRGYKVGQVTDLRFNPQTGEVLIEFEVLREIPLPIDSRATITNLDLLGTKGLWLVPGQAEKLAADGDTLQDSLATGTIDKTIQELRPVRDKLDQLLAQLNETASHLNKLIADTGVIPQTVRSIQGLAHTVEGEVSPTTARLRSTLHNLDTTIQALRPALQGTLASTHRLSDSLAQNLPTLLKNLQNATHELDSLLIAINKGEGTLGHLARDPSLYKNLDATTVSLRKLLDELRTHPERFVHFSIFGRRKNKDEE